MNGNGRILLSLLLLLQLLLLFNNIPQTFGREKNKGGGGIGNRMAVTSFEATQMQSSYIKSFQRVSDKDEFLYVANIIQRIAQLQVSVHVSNDQTARKYIDKELNCCQLLEGMGNGIMRRFYSHFIVNNSFHCPFKPNRYFLRLELSRDMMPALHPRGKFKIDIRLQLPNDTVLLNLIWKYSVFK